MKRFIYRVQDLRVENSAKVVFIVANDIAEAGNFAFTELKIIGSAECIAPITKRYQKDIRTPYFL